MTGKNGTAEDFRTIGALHFATAAEPTPERDERHEKMAEKIAKEIKQTSGFDDIAELREAMPDNPDNTGDVLQPERAKRGRKAGASPSPSRRKSPAMPAPAPDPFANDARYQAACGRMAAFGGKGMIVRGFDAGATILDDPKFKLDEGENLAWDDFFYVLSKKPAFDVGKPLFLALFFVITLCAQLGWRILERTESEFIHSLFAPKPKEGETIQ